MEEKELIKKYLESIQFSTFEAYINLIAMYVKFKEDYLKSQIKEEPKVKKDLKEAKK